MNSVWIALALYSLATLPIHAASKAQRTLVSDKDTVAGIDTNTWNLNLPWTPSTFIRIRNTATQSVFLDSLRIPSDSIGSRLGTYGRPLGIIFAVRTYRPGVSVRAYVDGIPKAAPIALGPGDSLDLGLFEIGRIAFLVKASAASRLYVPGDSLNAPLTLYAGSDSIRFILKAKTRDFTYGVGLFPIRAARPGPPADVRLVTADGRAVPKARPAIRVQLEGPGPRN